MNINFVIALMATSFLEQTIVTLVRVTTSYRAVELGISVVGIGIIAAAFSILPIAMAVALGRYIDKGNDARAVWYGAALMILSCAGFLVAESQLTLILFTAVLGASHMVMTVGLQVLCARQEGPGMMEKMVGNYMVANAIGQGLGCLHRRLYRRRCGDPADRIPVRHRALVVRAADGELAVPAAEPEDRCKGQRRQAGRVARRRVGARLWRPVHDRHRQRRRAGSDRDLHAAAWRCARHLGR